MLTQPTRLLAINQDWWIRKYTVS